MGAPEEMQDCSETGRGRNWDELWPLAPPQKEVGSVLVGKAQAQVGWDNFFGFLLPKGRSLQAKK